MLDMRTYPSIKETIMSDLSNSVIMPREDFVELSTVAFDNSHVPSASERVASVAQTTAVFGVMGAAIIGVTWGCTKAVDWLEERRLRRMKAESEINTNATK